MTSRKIYSYKCTTEGCTSHLPRQNNMETANNNLIIITRMMEEKVDVYFKISVKKTTGFTYRVLVINIG